MKNKLLNGVTILIIANLVGKFLGMVYRIPLSNILGAEGMGLYQMSFPVYSFCLILISGGLPTALSKLVAESRAEKKYDNIWTYFNSSIIYSVVFGFIFALVFLFFGEYMAFFQGNVNATIGYKTISIAILFASVSSCFKGFFQGFEEMLPTAISTLIEQFFKLLFGILFSVIFIDKGLEYGVFGAILGLSLAEVISFLFLLGFLIFNKKKYPAFLPIRTSVKKIVKFSFPFTLMSIITPFTTLVESFFVVNILSKYFLKTKATALYGILTGMVNPIINFPIILASCLSVVLLPNLTYAIKSKNNTIDIVSKSYKYIWIFVIACTFGYNAVGNTMLNVLFPEAVRQYGYVCKTIFTISSLNIVFLSIAQISTSIMQASEKIYTPVINLAISSIIRIVLSIVLISIEKYNIFGLVFANTLSYGIYAILNIYSVKDNYNFNFGIKNVFIPFLSGLVMYIICSFITSILSNYNNIVSLLISVIIGVIVYFALLFIFKVFTKEEIFNVIRKSKKRL